MLIQVNLVTTMWYTVEPEEDQDIIYLHDHLTLVVILCFMTLDMLTNLGRGDDSNVDHNQLSRSSSGPVDV